MWKNFEGKARTLEESVAYMRSLKWGAWRPQGVTVHATSLPTLAMWAESGPKHDQRIINLQRYYEEPDPSTHKPSWHAGPHWFISRTMINWFSDPLLPGIHSRCYNGTRFGIEMVGDYEFEPFDTGDGKLVRDLSVSWCAALNLHFGFKAEDVVFHRECKIDNHACPGKLVKKDAFIDLVKARMSDLGKDLPVIPAVPKQAEEPKPAAGEVLFQVEGRMSTFGGPQDRGVGAAEGLGVFDSEAQFSQAGLDGWLLSRSQAGAPGLARRLDPNKPYVACRWDYTKTPKAVLRNSVVEVEALKNGKKATARPMDWGPNVSTRRAADLSPGLAKQLDLQTDDQVRVTLRRA